MLEHLSRIAIATSRLSPGWVDTIFTGHIMKQFTPRLSNSAVVLVSMYVLLLFIKLSPAHAAHEHEETVPEADPGSDVPRLSVPEYRSPLSAYQPFEDADGDWKEANDRVGEIGGWRVYSREPFEEDNTNDTDKDSQ